MTDALLSDLRALTDLLAKMEAMWRQERAYAERHGTPYAEGARDAYDSAEAYLRGLIAKHEAKQDASGRDFIERDDLTQVIRSVTAHRNEPLDNVHDVPPIVNAILAAGWRRR